MLCDLNHKLTHDGKLYINPKQGFGNENNFLEKYSDGITEKMSIIINKNIDIASRTDSFYSDNVLDFYGVEHWDNKDEIRK